jgi:hypothetical protein
MRVCRTGFVYAAVFIVVVSSGCGGTRPKAYYGAATVKKVFAAHGISLLVILRAPRETDAVQALLWPIHDPATPPSVEVDVYRNEHFASVYLDLVAGPHAVKRFRPPKGTQILRHANVVVLYQAGSQFPLTSVRASLNALG